MKKILSLALCLGLVAASFASCTSKRYDPAAETTNINDIAIQGTVIEETEFEIPEEELVYESELDYEYSENILKLTGYTGDAEELEIPTSLTHPDYGVLPVKTVGDAAFLGNETLKKVIIPEGIETIGTGAFQSCKNLTDVVIFEGKTIPAGTELEDGTVTEQDEVVAPSLKTIKANAFNNSGLVNINIPETVTTIGQFAFSSFLNPTPWYDSLKAEKVIVGDGILLKYNGKGNVEFGKEVKRVAYYAFRTPGEITVKFNEDLKAFDNMAVYEVEGKYAITFLVPYKSEASKLIDATPYNCSVHGVPVINGNPFKWEFNSASDVEPSWWPNHVEMNYQNGALHAVATGADPIVSCEDKLNIPTEFFHTMKIRMKHEMAVAKTAENSTQYYMQVYFDNGSGLSEGASVRFNIEQSSNGQYIDYTLDMTGDPWKDVIKYFRIDTPNGLEGEFWIESVEFIPDDDAFDFNSLLKPIVKKVKGEDNPHKYKFEDSESQATAWAMTGFEYSYAPIKEGGDNNSIHGILDPNVESSITSPVLNASGLAYRSIIVRMRGTFDEMTADNADQYLMKVYFDNGNGFSEDRCKAVRVEETSMEEKIEYVFKMYKVDGWYDGTIKNIKIVLPEGLGGEFWIDKVEFVEEDKLTRSDVVNMLHKADGGFASGESIFFDVVVYDKYCNAIIWATQNELIDRAADNMFYPDRYVTAAEYADLMNRYAALKGLDTKYDAADASAPVYKMDAQKAINAACGIEEIEEEEEDLHIFIDKDPKFTWTFTDASEVEQWGLGCMEASLVDNTFYANIIPNDNGGLDPNMYSPVMNMPAADYKTLKIRMKFVSDDERLSANSMLQVFFDNGTGLSETNSIRADLQANTEDFVEYTLDMSTCEGWVETIKSIRIDPTNNVKGEFWIESIAFAA